MSHSTSLSTLVLKPLSRVYCNPSSWSHQYTSLQDDNKYAFYRKLWVHITSMEICAFLEITALYTSSQIWSFGTARVGSWKMKVDLIWKRIHCKMFIGRNQASVLHLKTNYSNALNYSLASLYEQLLLSKSDMAFSSWLWPTRSVWRLNAAKKLLCLPNKTGRRCQGSRKKLWWIQLYLHANVYRLIKLWYAPRWYYY